MWAAVLYEDMLTKGWIYRDDDDDDDDYDDDDDDDNDDDDNDDDDVDDDGVYFYIYDNDFNSRKHRSQLEST